MKSFLVLVFAVATLQLASASVIRDDESTTLQPSAPQNPQTSPVGVPEVAPQVPEHKNTVDAHVVEHTEENNDHVDKVDGYDPNDDHVESYEVTPEEKLYSEFAESPDAEDSKPATEGTSGADSSSSADTTVQQPIIGALI